MKRIILSVTESTALTKLQSEIPAMAADSEELLVGGFIGVSMKAKSNSTPDLNLNFNDCSCQGGDNNGLQDPSTPTPTPIPTNKSNLFDGAGSLFPW